MNAQDFILQIVMPLITIVTGGGWFVTYKAYKRKNEGEATQAEADGWKAQQDVYQQTITDLKGTCAYIKEDRNLLREENRKLREENNELREKYNAMENQIIDLRKQVAKLGRKLEGVLPFTCAVAACANRTRVEIHDDDALDIEESNKEH